MSTQTEIDAHFAALTTDGCNQPVAWLRTARNLLSGAEAIMTVVNAGRRLIGHPDVERTAEEDDLVSRSVQTVGQALMLYAFAIECLFKAVYLKADGVLYVNGTVNKLSGVSISHDLLQVCDAVGLKDYFDQDQKTVLDRLTLWTEIGRYPAPLKSTRYGHKLLDNGWMYMRGIWSYTDEVTTFRILEALYLRLEEEMPIYAQILLEAQQNSEDWRSVLQARLVPQSHE